MAAAARSRQPEESMDRAFKALADPGRRRLLDRLYQRDGQRLYELETVLDLTRFGVMKHLRVLENAGLITTRRAGREKFHYLNPVLIRMIYDRWVSKYAEPFAAALTSMKTDLENHTDRRSTMKVAIAPKHVQQIYIRTTPERLWQALTVGEFTRQYYFNGSIESDWKPGSSYVFHNPNGGVDIQGKVLEVLPPSRLVMTFDARWDDQVKKDRPSRVTFEIQQQGENCCLTLVHDELEEGSATLQQVTGGWPVILSSLKTLLETGKPLQIQMP